MNDRTVHTSGYRAAASTSGYGAAASTSGHGAAASTSGDEAAASTSGDWAAASTSGYWAAASTSGYGAAASTSGYGSRAVALLGAAESRKSIAIGLWVRLSDESNAAVVLPPDDEYEPYVVSRQDGWEAGVWITMEDGCVVERPDVLLPSDLRGYRLTHVNGRYIAGCRNFSYDEAVAHWSNPDHRDPVSARMLLDEVERHHAKQAA